MSKNKKDIDEPEIPLLFDDEKVVLATNESINHTLSGDIEKLEIGFAQIQLKTTQEMLADNVGLIHSGFIFSAADFAAKVAVNEKNIVLVASECQFLSPVKLYDIVRVEAKVQHKDGRKRNVSVEAFVLDIKVFVGEFKTVVTDKHILRLKLYGDEE